MKQIFIFLLRMYQRTLSPDHGLFRARYPYGFCRHFPSCSSYAITALQKDSLPQALFSIVKRILHCNPFSPITL